MIKIPDEKQEYPPLRNIFVLFTVYGLLFFLSTVKINVSKML